MGFDIEFALWLHIVVFGGVWWVDCLVLGWFWLY